VEIERRVELRFHPDAVAANTHINLSAVRSDGRCLWVAGDETATVERLTPEEEGFGNQRVFRLADLVDLPGPAEQEADIEGLARSGGFLWAIGSHSLIRKRVKPTHLRCQSDTPAQPGPAGREPICDSPAGGAERGRWASGADQEHR
jgi:hypothetical protein